MRDNRKIVLASASPRRKLLMKKICSSFCVAEPSLSTEKKAQLRPCLRPSSFVKHMARAKSLDIMKRYPKALVIGADTIVYCNGHIIEKPKSYGHAVKLLSALAGYAHDVYTGIAVGIGEKRILITQYAKSRVKIRRLTKRDIHDYFLLVNPMDKAGAYAIQEHGEMIVESITGEYDNVVGFPVSLVKQMLKSLGGRS